MAAQVHLLIYEFGPGAEFEGQLVGALERIQARGQSRLLDGLFAAHDPETGELAAIELSSKAGAIATFLTFRLDPDERRKATESALADSGSVPAEVVRSVGRVLKPGGAMLVLLMKRPGWRELGDAVRSTGGSLLRAEPVAGASLAELGPDLLARVDGGL